MAEAAKSLKVFVSYSRTDVDFADQLVLALEDKGFEAILDRHDMSGGENWRERLGKLILSADAVAFILTPKSAASEICAWEVEEARRLGKRILPLTPGSIAGVTPPAALGDLNWIPFYAEPAVPGSGFYYGVMRLTEALSVDLDWLRAQTRYSERAQEWSRARPDDLLLRGEALKEAEGWLARTPSGSHPPDLVREYLAAGGNAEQHRQAAAKAQLEEREQALKTAEAAVAEKQAAIAAKMKADRMMRVLSIGAMALAVVVVATAIAGIWYSTRRSIDVNDQRAAQFAAAAQQLSDEGHHAKAMLVAILGDPAAERGLIEPYFRREGYSNVTAALERAYTHSRLAGYYPVPDFPIVTSFTPGGLQFITTNISTDTKAISAKLWRAGESDPLVLFGDENTPLDIAAYSPNGSYVASSVRGEPIEIRKSGSATPEWTISPADHVENFDAAVTIAVSDDGAAVLVGLVNGKAVLWQRDKAEPVAVYGSDDVQYQLVALSGDGARLMITAGDGFEVWEAGKKERSLAIATHSEVQTLSFSKNGQWVLSLTAEGKVRVNDIATGEEMMTYLDPESPVIAAVFSPDNTSLAMGRIDGVVQVMLLTGPSPPVVIGGHADPVFGLAYAHDGLRLASSSIDQTVRVWSMQDSLQVEALGRPDEMMTAAALMPVGDTILLGRNDGGIDIWRSGAKAPETKPGLWDNAVRVIAPLPGGDEVVVLDWQSTIMLRRLDSDAPDTRFGGLDVGVTTISVSPDGKMLLAGTENGAALWQIDQPDKPIWTATNFPAGIYSVAFSSDSQFYVLGGAALIEVWKVGGDKPADTYKGILYQGVAFAFVPGTDTYIMTFANGRMQQRRIGDPAPVRAFLGHSTAVQSISLSADGSLMLTAGNEGAFLWRTSSSAPIARVPDKPLTWVGLMPDGKRAVLFDRGSGEARIWTLDPILFAGPKDKAKLACEALAKAGMLRISPEDRLRYPVLEAEPEEPCAPFGVAAPPLPPASAMAAAVGAPE
jgi:WD40 repeat protein